LADVGAGENILGQTLVKLDARFTVIGLDLFDEDASTMTGPRLDFRPLRNPRELPLPGNSVDVTLFRYSLHHMDFSTQEALLREALRILSPGGQIKIIEDSFSRSLHALVGNVYHQRLLKLTDSEIVLVLALLDASSSLFTEERMPFAFSFRSIEEWLRILGDIGFVDLSVDYWGMPMFSLYQAPAAIITAKCRD
jgi:SAM-dependent methyltransferase